MGEAEGTLLVTGASLLGVAALGGNLAVAIWKGRLPRTVPLSAWLGVILLAASVLLTREAHEDVALVAGAAHQPPRQQPGLEIRSQGSDVVLLGRGRACEDCGIWAVIEDPRTGVIWLQGPAALSGEEWMLHLVLGTGRGEVGPLVYGASVAVFSEEAHRSWLARALTGAPIAVSAVPAPSEWLALDLAIEVDALP